MGRSRRLGAPFLLWLSAGGSDQGIVREGTLLLVRHLDVEWDELRGLIDYVNRERPAAGLDGVDPVLLRALRRYGSDRMAGVVKTIQAEQNELIRFPLDRHFIV